MEEEQGTTSAKRKQEEKHRKKDSRSWENILKAIATMDEAAKLLYIEQKYKEVYNDVRKLSGANQQLNKQIAIIHKEKDHNQSELAKSVVARARLENLCRELQKQNKQIKEENIAKIKEEEERRKEVSLKFADKLSDINSMMDENKEKSEKLREENLKMTAKLADLYSQFQKREEDIAKMSRQLELERQFSQATLAKMELEIKAEKEMHNREQAIMKSNLEKSEANRLVLLETVKGLQEHIDVYKHQYEDFENTMSKSAKVFHNYKFEIADMTKQVASLEQEAVSWKQKYHDSMKALLDVTESNQNQEGYLRTMNRKNDQLEQLCRQLQSDRSAYLNLLKSHGIEPPKNTVNEKPPTEDSSKKGDTSKMTKKEKELQSLKEDLKAVQDQLQRVTREENTKSETCKTDDSTSQSTDVSPVQVLLPSVKS